MTEKWEYKVVRILEARKFEESLDTDGPGLADKARDIDELGMNGWELVSVVNLTPIYDALPHAGMESGRPVAYFKRLAQN